VVYFKPRGIPIVDLEEIVMTLDEFEAVRMADLEGMYQEAAAQKMNVSRQTFGNIVEQGRKKIADALVNGKALRIEGGQVKISPVSLVCVDCRHQWVESVDPKKAVACPRCGGVRVQKEERMDSLRRRGRHRAHRCRGHILNRMDKGGH